MFPDEIKLVFIAQFVKAQFLIESTCFVTFHFIHTLVDFLFFCLSVCPCHAPVMAPPQLWSLVTVIALPGWYLFTF